MFSTLAIGLPNLKHPFTNETKPSICLRTSLVAVGVISALVGILALSGVSGLHQLGTSGGVGFLVGGAAAILVAAFVKLKKKDQMTHRASPPVDPLNEFAPQQKPSITLDRRSMDDPDIYLQAPIENFTEEELDFIIDRLVADRSSLKTINFYPLPYHHDSDNKRIEVPFLSYGATLKGGSLSPFFTESSSTTSIGKHHLSSHMIFLASVVNTHLEVGYLNVEQIVGFEPQTKVSDTLDMMREGKATIFYDLKS